MIENLECRRFRNRIDAFLDGELTPSEREEMARHASACADCGRLLSEYQEMLNMLSELDEGVQIPEEAARAWRSRVRDEAERDRSRKGRGWLRPLAGIAAAVTLLLGVTSAYRAGLFAPKPTNALYKTASYEDYGGALYDSADNSGYNMTSSMASGVQVEAAGARTAARIESDGAADETAGADAQTARKPVILRTASRTIETTRFEADLEEIETLTDDNGGWLEARNVNGRPFADGGSGRSAGLEIRVPTERLDAFLDAVKGVGATTRTNDGAQDVSAEYYDSQTRLIALRAQYERLTELITDAADLSDLIALEDKLYEVQYEIDSLEGSLRDIESRAGYSSVTISLNEVREYTEPPVENPSVGERIREGFEQSVEWLRGFLQDMLVAVVTFSPALVVIVPGILILWLIVRAIRAKKRRGGRA